MKTEMAREVKFDTFGVDCVIGCSSICYRALGHTSRGQKRERTCRALSFRSETESRFALNASRGIGNRLGGVTYFHFWKEGSRCKGVHGARPGWERMETDAGAYKFCGRGGSRASRKERRVTFGREKKEWET
jgi:hypothetical protein